MLAGGCATKKYVRNTTAPVQAKVDQVGEQTTKQGQEIQETRTTIKQVDERAQTGISAAQERASAAESKATAADSKATDAIGKADQATQMASQNTEALNSLRTVVSNLDDYRMQKEVTVPFKFDQYKLTDQAKQELDALVADVKGAKRYFIAVEGYTDRTGSVQYNDALSRRRADAVMQYLVANHDVPVFRVHIIGLGEQKPVEEGRTRAARAKNRRVEVKLFSADQALQGSTTAMSGSSTAAQPPVQQQPQR
jgi:outer membrane protein OmpA-like peptidoglycan-associated protein